MTTNRTDRRIRSDFMNANETPGEEGADSPEQLWGGSLMRSVSPGWLPQLNRIALRVVQAGKAAVRVMLRVYFDRNIRCP
ncbi:MAG TPA: hypothetical protein VIX14_12450 [Terriglobales bacterium]